MIRFILAMLGFFFIGFTPYKQHEQYEERKPVVRENTEYNTNSTVWSEACDTGSIMDIADIQWAMDNAPYFNVETKEELAGVVYYVNTANEQGQAITINLKNDIDLAGLEWVPMGWLGKNNNAFIGVIDGEGHTIRNMTIQTSCSNHTAFVAYSYGLTVKNISFENAYVSGGIYTGIVGGEVYTSEDWENINVSGIVESDGNEVGSIIGREAYINFVNCKANVGLKRSNEKIEPLKYFSHRYEVLDNTPATEDFNLKVNKDGSVTRTELDGYRNLCWHIENNGTLLLQRNAEGETTLSSQYAYKGSTIWLEAFTGETYTRVSNIVEIK